MGRLEQRARAEDKRLSRRNFLILGTGAGLAFGFARGAGAHEIFPPPPPGAAEAAQDAFEPTIWCAITPDGLVNVNIVRAEMGQHIGTALARIIADEMEADWDRVRIVQVDTEERFAGQYVTGGSWSVWMTWDVFRQAGAAARTILVEEGAKLLGAPPAQCVARNGAVFHGPKSLTYGEIVSRAKPTRRFTAEEMAALPLKPASERRLIGREVAALDIPGKTTGEAVYGIDVKLPDMVYARPKLPPTRFGAKVLSVDDTKAQKIDGYQRYLILDDPSGNVQGWVVAVAESYIAAMRAAEALAVTWTKDPALQVSEQDILEHAKKLEADPQKGIFLYNDPGVDEAIKSSSNVLTRSYSCASVAHVTLEPLNALARRVDGLWEIHAGNQWQSLILPQLAKALGVPQEQIVMRTYLLGGGFGRRLNGDYTIPAALASKALDGKPVKLILTRADDMAFDSIRSPSLQTISVALDASRKKIAAMDYAAIAGWPTLVNAPAFMAKGLNGQYDQFASSGADHWYETGPFRLRAINNDLADRTFRPGWLRSVGAGWTPWALESFMDEIAHATGQDPVAFRLSMFTATGRNAGSAPDATGGAARQAEVLKRLAEKVGWGKTRLPADTALGIATGFGQERAMPTWIAGAVQVHVDRATGVVTCQKIWLVLDAGTIVDPDGALAQTQGAALWGLSMALFEGTEIVNGTIKDRNFNTYTPARLADTPEVDIEFMSNTYKPTGLGEPGVTVIAPAIGNAIFNAVGIRLRHIPIRPRHVLEALKNQQHS